MILINKSKCFNARFQFSYCTICQTNCHKKCINSQLELDSTACDECGLCISKCPAHAIAGDAYSYKNFYTMFSSSDEALCLSCKQCNISSQWGCLGFLDARMLFLLVLNRKERNAPIKIASKQCFQCNETIARYLETLISSLNTLLKLITMHYIEPIHLEFLKKEEYQLTARRSFFRNFLTKSANTLAMTSNSNSLEPITVYDTFQKIINQLHIADIPPIEFFFSLHIKQNCSVCSLCQNICPQNALTIIQNDNLASFYHEPSICNGCNLCSDICTENAINLIWANSLSRKKIEDINIPHCVQCGKPYTPMAGQKKCLSCFYQEQPNVFDPDIDYALSKEFHNPFIYKIAKNKQ